MPPGRPLDGVVEHEARIADLPRALLAYLIQRAGIVCQSERSVLCEPLPGGRLSLSANFSQPAIICQSAHAAERRSLKIPLHLATQPRLICIRGAFDRFSVTAQSINVLHAFSMIGREQL